MATPSLGAESAHANPLNIFATFDRRTLESAVEVLVAVLDTIDGDPDVEDDDPAGQCDEDGINTNLTEQWSGRPGCRISDPEEDDDPAGGNVTDEPHDEDDGF